MNYHDIVGAIFISRPNRFIAFVELDGQKVVAHVKNTGRCKELLIPGRKVFLSVADNPTRKTKYDLIAIEKTEEGRAPLLINMDSQVPNDVVEEWLPKSGLFSQDAVFRREVVWHDSRFDFQIKDGDKTTFLEVKGVTLEDDGVARFPDAPTERGLKHIHELMACRQEGYGAIILFVVQMKGMKELRPNDETHPQFGMALREASQRGVKILAMDCNVTPSTLIIDKPLPVVL